MNDIEWRYLLTGPMGDIQVTENPTDWLDDLAWPDKCKQFKGMA